MLTYLSAWTTVHTPIRNQRGASAVEYAMLVAMAGVMIGVVFGFGKAVDLIFDETLSNNGVSSTTP